MKFLLVYGYFVAGIVLSVIVPVAVKWMREASESLLKGIIMEKLSPYIRSVLKIAAASAILGVILLLFFLAGGAKIEEVTWYNAVLYGYGWDATLQKREATKMMLHSTPDRFQTHWDPVNYHCFCLKDRLGQFADLCVNATG